MGIDENHRNNGRLTTTMLAKAVRVFSMGYPRPMASVVVVLHCSFQGIHAKRKHPPRRVGVCGLLAVETLSRSAVGPHHCRLSSQRMRMQLSVVPKPLCDDVSGDLGQWLSCGFRECQELGVRGVVDAGRQLCVAWLLGTHAVNVFRRWSICVAMVVLFRLRSMKALVCIIWR